MDIFYFACFPTLMNTKGVTDLWQGLLDIAIVHTMVNDGVAFKESIYKVKTKYGCGNFLNILVFIVS